MYVMQMSVSFCLLFDCLKDTLIITGDVMIKRDVKTSRSFTFQVLTFINVEVIHQVHFDNIVVKINGMIVLISVF